MQLELVIETDDMNRTACIKFPLGCILALGFLLLTASFNSVPAADFALKDRDRVLFYGDSITEQRLYTTYIEQYVLTHYPDRRITFINTAWGGDAVTGNGCVACAGVGGLARLKRDVIDYHPTVVTILFGMNDGEYRDFDPAVLKVYEDGLTAIIHELKSHTRARLYLMTPTVYDGTRHTSWSHTDRYNATLDRYSEAGKQLAAREGLPVIDLHTATTTALDRAKAVDPAYTFLPDGVHPEADGHLVIAAEILRAWGASPMGTEVSQQVQLVKLGPATSTSVRVTAPLPWPIPLPSQTLRGVTPGITELGQILVKLEGLPAGTYKLSVDETQAGEFSAEQLRAGIPVGELSVKSVTRSRELAALLRQRADLFQIRWRQVAVPFEAKYRTGPAAVASLDLLISELAKRSRLLAQAHVYEITISAQN
jgi:lysophospholipase L1-like esterase